MSWLIAAAKIETKQTLSYRVDFWLQFAVTVVVEVGIAYYLWSSIFGDDLNKTIGGYTFEGMLIYYLFVPFVGRMVKSLEDFSTAREIREGGINKFLIYPVSYLQYKLMQKTIFTALACFQMFLGLFIVAYFLGVTVPFSFSAFALGILSSFASMILYATLLTSLELVAFWADTVWSLGVMLRFIAMFFGGAFVPLSLFPDWALKILYMTPFPYLFATPIQTFMGQNTVPESLSGIAVTIGWSIPLFAVMYLIYRRGLKQYSGIGI